MKRHKPTCLLHWRLVLVKIKSKYRPKTPFVRINLATAFLTLFLCGYRMSERTGTLRGYVLVKCWWSDWDSNQLSRTNNNMFKTAILVWSIKKYRKCGIFMTFKVRCQKKKGTSEGIDLSPTTPILRLEANPLTLSKSTHTFDYPNNMCQRAYTNLSRSKAIVRG